MSESAHNRSPKPSHRRLSSAHILAGLALFVALGGSALAMKKNSIGSKQIRDGAVRTLDVKDAALSGADIASDSLSGADVDESTLALPTPGPAVPAGPAGGALSGEFPNPGLADASVTKAALGANSVDDTKIGGSEVGASEIASSSINSSEVNDSSLNGDDIGRDSGTVNVDFPPIPAGDCSFISLDLGVAGDFRDDAFLGTPEEWPQRVSLYFSTGDVPGTVRMHACSHNPNFSENPFPTDLRWVAINVN